MEAAARGRGGVPAGWYPDPSGVAPLRWWDGDRWTEGVSDGTTVSEAPLPPPEEAPARHDERPQWPLSVVGVALAGAVVGVVLAALGAAAGDALAGGVTAAFSVALAQAGLSAGLLGACWVASRRYGSGRVGPDLGLEVRAADWPVGFGLSWVARIVGVVVVLPLVLVDRRYAGSNLEALDELAGDVAALVLLALVTVVVAPVVEELFFRGLLQRALEPVLRPAGAIGVQAVLFGLAHLSVALGPGNVSVVAATAAGGVVFGLAAWRARRLGPSLTAHGFYNLIGLLVALAFGVG